MIRFLTTETGIFSIIIFAFLGLCLILFLEEKRQELKKEGYDKCVRFEEARYVMVNEHKKEVPDYIKSIISKSCLWEYNLQQQ